MSNDQTRFHDFENREAETVDRERVIASDDELRETIAETVATLRERTEANDELPDPRNLAEYRFSVTLSVSEVIDE